jgi:dinuclear metal center YbgI/SA1388 family protein
VKILAKLNRIIEAVNRLAPAELAESWDQVGLQVGRTETVVNKVLVAVDLNGPVIAEGQQHQVDGYIVHHPLIFKPLTAINPATHQGSLLTHLIKNDRFLLVAHTNLDNSEQGINQYLAELLKLIEVESILSANIPMNKVVVFVPEKEADRVRQAMAEAGAGEIGAYRECSFTTGGTGTFRPVTGAQPCIGKPGAFSSIPENRLEMIVPQSGVSRVLQAVGSVHPYEEPAIDIYPLRNSSRHGTGRIGILPQPLRLGEFCCQVKHGLKAAQLKVSGAPEREIRKVAICSGSGGGYVKDVVHHGADLYLTGEMNYHDHWEAKECGLAVIEAGHWTTEHCFIRLMADYLEREFSNDTDFKPIRSRLWEGEPFRIV